MTGAEAVESTLRVDKANLERELRQTISERERFKLAHDTLKEEHAQQQRAAVKAGEALHSVKTVLGLRK